MRRRTCKWGEGFPSAKRCCECSRLFLGRWWYRNKIQRIQVCFVLNAMHWSEVNDDFLNYWEKWFDCVCNQGLSSVSQLAMRRKNRWKHKVVISDATWRWHYIKQLCMTKIQIHGFIRRALESAKLCIVAVAFTLSAFRHGGEDPSLCRDDS